MNQTILLNIRKALVKVSDEKTRQSSYRFFKEAVKLHGVKSTQVYQIKKQFFPQVKIMSKAALFALAEAIYKDGYCEEQWLVADWVYRFNKEFEPSDFPIFERWIEKYISNWASCDTFCNHTMGTFIEMYPQFLDNLITWTQSKNRWVKRASAVSLILPARRGKFLEDVFQIADNLLLDPDDMVQKGYGWLLKEASRQHQQEVFDYVIKHKAVMPRTALRYAIEKMPEKLRKKAMER